MLNSAEYDIFPINKPQIANTYIFVLLNIAESDFMLVNMKMPVVEKTFYNLRVRMYTKQDCRLLTVHELTHLNLLSSHSLMHVLLSVDHLYDFFSLTNYKSSRRHLKTFSHLS